MLAFRLTAIRTSLARNPVPRRPRCTAFAASAAASAALCTVLAMSESEKLAGHPGMATRAEQEGALRRGRVTAAVHHDHPAAGRQAGEPPMGDKQMHATAPHRLPLTVPEDGAGDGAPTSGKSVSGQRCATAYLGVSDNEGKRSHMEDRHTLIPDFAPPGADPALPRQFVAVYDGHSSHHGSEHASRRVHEFIAAQPAVQAALAGKDDPPGVEAALKAAFEQADEEIVGKAVQSGKRYGTTAVCALRVGGTLYVAHAGDSRAVLCRDHQGVTLTKDHKPASVPEERQRIEAQGGRIVVEADRVVSNPEGQRRSRLNMSRALGDPDFKSPRKLVDAEPDVARLELCPESDAFLLLGSDGLFEVLSAQQAVAAVAAELSAHRSPSDAAAEAAADAVVSKALKAGTSDNVTALVMLLDW